MKPEEIVRAHGCNLRSVILQAHIRNGAAIGLAVLERQLWEIGANGAEIHSKETMASLMYAAADAMMADAGPSIVVEIEVPAPEKPAAPAETPLTAPVTLATNGCGSGWLLAAALGAFIMLNRRAAP